MKKCMFLAGARGAIGRRLAPLLVADGWRVVGSTRSANTAGMLRETGVEPAVVDVFDAGALRKVVADVQPVPRQYSVLSLATSPSRAEPLTISPRAWILPGSMLRLQVALLPKLLSAMRSRRHLVIANLALRKQLATLAGRQHPDIRPADRVFWILLRRYWSRWAQAHAIVEPDTVVRWHRAGFRGTMRWNRRAPSSGAFRSSPPASAFLRNLSH